MEKIVSHLKLAECKQSSLCKAHEQLHSEASSFLLFSLQWKDLETHLGSTRELIQTQYEELERREKAVALKEERLDDLEKSICECSKELESKRKELSVLNRSIEKCDREARLKERDLDVAQARLGVLSKDIKVKEDEFEEKEKAFGMIQKRIDDCEQLMELKELKLNEMTKLMNERSMECDSKGKHLESIRVLIQEHEDELVTKEKQYDAIQNAIKDTNREVKLKEKELESIQNCITTMWKEKRLDKIEKSIKLRTEELDLKDQELVLMQDQMKHLSEDLSLKESELESIKICITEHSKELDVQEKQLNGTHQSIRDCENVIILLTKYVSSIKKAIIQCSKEWALDENHLHSLKESVDDYSNELPSVVKQHNSIDLIVDKCLDSLNAQKERFNLLRRSIEERSKNLKNEENDFERRTEELNKKSEEVNRTLKNLDAIKADMDSKMILMEKSREELRLKEIQHNVRAEKLESKEKDISLARPLKEKSNENVELMDVPNILDLKVKTEESKCRPTESSNALNFHTGSTTDGNFLLVFLCEHLILHDLVCKELLISLQSSLNPAKMLLEAMKWFYSPHVVFKDEKINLHSVKRGCIMLSELFLRFRPQITPTLKEEALKLANQWKPKIISMARDNHLEVLAFLLLTANFQLTSDFDAEELTMLLNSVSQYKQGFEVARALGIGDKSSEGSATPSPVKLEQPESLAANEAANEGPVSSLKNDQHKMDPNEKRLYLLLNKELTREKLMASGIFIILKESSDPPKLALDIIQDSFHQQLKRKPTVFEESFLRGSTLLLKQLKQISPSIGLKVKEDALKLAIDWKMNISSDAKDSLNAVGFLQFLTSYGLTSSFSGNEILKLFENIVMHEQASELCLMFGYLQKIQDFVQNLIGTKQFVKAVKFICGYKLESFRSEQILNEYLRDARNATLNANKKNITGHIQGDRYREAIDNEIAAVKSVITCVEECNLGSVISSQGLHKRIVALEGMRRKKCNRSSTTVNMQQPHNPNLEAQRPLQSMQLHPPHSVNFEARQSHSSHQPQHPPPTNQPHKHPPPPPNQPHKQHPPPNQPHQQLHPPLPTNQPHKHPPTNQPHKHPPPPNQPHKQHPPPPPPPNQPHKQPPPPPPNQPYQQPPPPPTNQPHKNPSPPTNQPHKNPSPPPTNQSHPFDNAEPQQVARKRKNSQFESDPLKHPRKSPQPRLAITSSTRGNNEESKFQQYTPRFSGIHGLFGLDEEGGRESTEHVSPHARLTPRPKL